MFYPMGNSHTVHGIFYPAFGKWHFALRCLLSALAGVALSFLIYTLC